MEFYINIKDEPVKKYRAEVMKLDGNTTDIPSYWSHNSYHEFIKYVEILQSLSNRKSPC